MTPPPPPLTALNDLDAQLRAAGFAVLAASSVQQDAGLQDGALVHLTPHWEDLLLDEHLRDDGRYRRRRHGAFILEGEDLLATPHRPHWQPVEYNALHGGIERWFAPLAPAMAEDPAWRRLLTTFAAHASRLRGAQRWFIEAHPFRIDATGGIGRPTPEGAHRDGVDLVVVLLVGRTNLRGGETRVFDARGPHGMRFTMEEPWSALLLDDERVVHETTPIQPLVAGAPAYRDTLVLTFRRGGFQGPEA